MVQHTDISWPVIREHWNMGSEHGWPGVGVGVLELEYQEPVAAALPRWQTKMSEIFFQLFLIGACSRACPSDRWLKSEIYSALILPEISSRGIPRLSVCRIARTNRTNRTATLMHVYVTANWLSNLQLPTPSSQLQSPDCQLPAWQLPATINRKLVLGKV